MEVCRHCNGTGILETYDIWGKKEVDECPFCKGRGKCNNRLVEYEINEKAKELERERYWDCYSEGITNANNRW